MLLKNKFCIYNKFYLKYKEIPIFKSFVLFFSFSESNIDNIFKLYKYNNIYIQ